MSLNCVVVISRSSISLFGPIRPLDQVSRGIRSIVESTAIVTLSFPISQTK